MRLGVNGRFYAAPVTGVQRYARAVVDRLAELADVTLLLPRDVEASDAPRTAVRARGILPGVAWEQLELPARARRLALDVVLHPANASPLWGGPHVVVLHDVLPFTHPRHFGRAYRVWTRIGHAPGARRAAGLATVSTWSAREIARTLGVPADGITVTGQGAAPLDHPAPPGEVEAVAAAHGLERPWFLALDGDRRKGLDLLLEVWTEPDPPPADLVVVGRATGSIAFPPPGVRHLGPVSDEELRALFAGARGFLFPSLAEGFGRPPLEALACGTRVAVAPYGPDDLLADAVERVPRDPAAWRDAVARLLAEPEGERRRKLEAGRALAAGHTWDAAAGTLLELCLRVARGGASGPGAP